MTLYRACKHDHVLVPVVNDIWVCECPAVYKKQGKHFLDPARKGLLDIVLKLMGGPQAIAERAKHLVDADGNKASQRTQGVISGYTR